MRGRVGMRSVGTGSVLGAAVLLLGTGSAAAQTSLTLFDGSTLQGWTARGPWNAGGGVINTAGSGERSVLLAVPFGECSLQFDYNEGAPVGAKLRLWATREDTGGVSVALDINGGTQGVGAIESLGRSGIKTLAPGWHHVQVEALRGTVSVRIDGQNAATASGLSGRAGYLGFEASLTGSLQVRNVHLTPGTNAGTFNGADLSGWKSVAKQPDAKGGMGHAVQKTFTLGIGGGSTKPHEAKWTVHAGAIHGEDGPGGLEYSTPSEDAVITLSAAVRGDVKPENLVGLSLRNPAGQLGGGYTVGVGPYAGSIDRLSRHGLGRAGTATDETIVIGGRTVAVWVGGTLQTVYTDPRPEGASTVQGARTQAGTASLLLPNGSTQLDVQRISITALAKPYGTAAHGMPPPPVTPASTAAVPAATGGSSAAENALLQQQQMTARKDAEDQANKQRTASLMGQALSTTDPQQQMQMYGQVVQIDPSNSAAVQGYKEAQARAQQQADAQQKAASTQASQQQEAQSREEQTNSSLVSAQAAFLAGRLGEASSALSVAERLSPGNPLVTELRRRISSAQSVHSRLYWLAGGAGVVGLLSVAALWLRRRRQQQFPVLEMTKGLDVGRTYPLEKELVRIGAVTQDAGQRNDIVVQDVEHAISRFHCEIARRDGNLYVTDLKSSNGTRLNDRPLQPGEPALLRKGGRILLANSVELRFRYDRRAKRT